MSIFVNKFMDTFNKENIIKESNTYDLGSELCNISSLALNEYSNIQSLLESTIDKEEQELLEAQMNILLEFSIKDIWEKIKKAFKWLIELVKKAKNWVKGLLSKSKVKKTKDNLKKAKENVRNNPAESKVDTEPDISTATEKAAKNAAEKGENVDQAVYYEIKKWAEYSIGQKDSISFLFYTTLYTPSIYFNPGYYYTSDFQYEFDSLINSFLYNIDVCYTQPAIDVMRTPEYGFSRDYKTNKRIGPGYIDRMRDDFISRIEAEYLNYVIFPKEFKEKYNDVVSLTKDNEYVLGRIEIDKGKLKNAINKENIEDMGKESKNIKDMENLIDFLENKVNSIENSHIKNIEEIIETLENLINKFQKEVSEKINELKKMKMDLYPAESPLKSGGKYYINTAHTRNHSNYRDLEQEPKTIRAIFPKKIQFLSSTLSNIIYSIKENIMVANILIKHTEKQINALNKLSDKLEVYTKSVAED